MVKRPLSLFVILPALLWTAACHAVKIEGPAPVTVHPKAALSQAKQSLAPKKLAFQELPATLGGLVQSDSWVIYKDKSQEEFIGHVSYDNGAYIFRSDYALSDRAKSTFSAKGNVFLRQNNPNGTFYQAQADDGFYNYHTQKGNLSARGKNPVILIFHDEKDQTTTATARKAHFDLNQKIYILEKDVHIKRETPTGIQTITAQKATVKQLQDYILLEGDATLSDGKRTLAADTMIYDGQNNASYAYGDRPLLQGISEQGTFAVIADNVQSDASGQRVDLKGKVQGWLVSPQINDTKLNTKF